MKSTWIAGLVICAGCWATQGAEGDQNATRTGDKPRREGRPDKGEMAEKIFERADTNGDGMLSKEEFLAALEHLRKMREERGGGPDGAGGAGGAGGGEMRGKLLEKFDKDGDGKLNDAEREAARQAFENRRKEGGDRKTRPESPLKD